MGNRRYASRTATIAIFLVGPWIGAFFLVGLWIGIPFPSAKASPGLVGIAPKKVADYIPAVLEADRSIYTAQVIDRMQEKGIVAALNLGSRTTPSPSLPNSFSVPDGWSLRAD